MEIFKVEWPSLKESRNLTQMAMWEIEKPRVNVKKKKFDDDIYIYIFFLLRGTSSRQGPSDYPWVVSPGYTIRPARTVYQII